MKRVNLFAPLFALLPLTAFAQVVPPPAPPSPVAPATPVAPIPAVPAVVTVAPMLPSQLAIEDALRAASDKLSLIDLDAVKVAMSDDMLALQNQARVFARQAAELGVQSGVQGQQGQQSDARAAQLKAGTFNIQDRTFTLRGGSNYDSGLSALGAKDYERAIERFDLVIAAKDPRADGAMYHKAFAEFRLGKTDDAQASINDLRKTYPQSRYLNDAKVLEADVKKQAGHPVRPEDANDDDIKLLAIQGIQNSDPARAVPLLQGVLTANNALSVKKRALYVLALSDQPEAHKILLDYAKGQGNPDLQRQAINYLATGSFRQQTTGAELQEIYFSTQDIEVRRAIIDAWRSTGNVNAIFRVDGKVDGKTITPFGAKQQAGAGLGAAELWTLYQKETNHDLKLQMLGNFGSMGAFDQLSQVARAEKDPALRQRAIRSLGSMKADKSGALLVELYSGDSDKETRKAIISALESQNNAEGLVGIARKETSSDLKLEIVRHLVNMASRSKVAADYLMEIIK
jgi:HEAT repeat protein/TolA-binding protein